MSELVGAVPQEVAQFQGRIKKPDYFRVIHTRGEDGRVQFLGLDPVARGDVPRVEESDRNGTTEVSQAVRIDPMIPAKHDLPPIEGRFTAEVPMSGTAGSAKR